MSTPHTPLLIRADGSTRLGMGHLYRSLALVKMLEGRYAATFVSKEITSDFISLLQQENCNIIPITDEQQYIDLCTPKHITIIDGHHFPDTLYRRVSEKGSRIICIDDLHDKTYTADIILNQAPAIRPADYHTGGCTYFALGPAYALLRQPFISAATHKRQRLRPTTCLICFGGGDQNNLTMRTLEIALELNALERIDVVTGSAYPFAETLKEKIQQHPHIRHHHDIGAEEMQQLMEAADIAVIPCSTILLEVFACGCIPVAGYYVENQKYFYENFLKQQAFIDAGQFGKDEIRKALTEALNYTENLPEIIDGKSPQRIRKLFALLDKMNDLHLRKATEDDAETTFQWASDPEVRRYSFNREKITREGHLQWFNRKINESRCHYYIAMYQGHSIGSIRFDVDGDTALISYLLDSKYHGRGMGQALLINGCRTFIQSYGTQVSLVGYVTPDNTASLKIFENIGFVRTDEPQHIKFTMSCR
ncbi:MAG: UDP-2,4-diacetamido-2,4,6-trideoxy-beta-L-altropyranose hydrolase [Saprospiraceae bacterium]|nr:UDP-2,4-diacetamido-2,4,6-trideoxy-beta-L-altropyranose hydrolase [Saprospiraceae bacterium]